MMRSLLLSLISISYEALLIVLPGLVFGVLFFVYFAGNWWIGFLVFILFSIYVIVVSSLKDKLLKYISKDGNKNDQI